MYKQTLEEQLHMLSGRCSYEHRFKETTTVNQLCPVNNIYYNHPWTRFAAYNTTFATRYMADSKRFRFRGYLVTVERKFFYPPPPPPSNVKTHWLYY